MAILLGEPGQRRISKRAIGRSARIVGEAACPRLAAVVVERGVDDQASQAALRDGE